eukprot:15460822-Alexandrium_andersonii.AAC.1
MAINITGAGGLQSRVLRLRAWRNLPFTSTAAQRAGRRLPIRLGQEHARTLFADPSALKPPA